MSYANYDHHDLAYDLHAEEIAQWSDDDVRERYADEAIDWAEIDEQRRQMEEEQEAELAEEQEAAKNSRDHDVWDTQGEVEGTFFCKRCAGTGRFITYVENGIPKGPGGPCFRCNGKGAHDQADRKRNHGYDCYGRRYH